MRPAKTGAGWADVRPGGFDGDAISAQDPDAGQAPNKRRHARKTNNQGDVGYDWIMV